MRVVEREVGHINPTDPVEWTSHHRDAEAEVRERLTQFADLRAGAVVIDGAAAESICGWASDQAVDLTVMGVGGDRSWPFAGMGSTARRVVEFTRASVLLLPPQEASGQPVRYQRIMTPLDGSSRAECALPIAASVAAAHEAEIVLIRALPNIELTQIGPLGVEDLTLCDRLRHRYERVAAQYLKRVKSWMPLSGAVTGTRLISSGDPRHALVRAAAEENVDLIVLTPTGLGGHCDVSVGSVADYLLNRTGKPILLVRGSGDIHGPCDTAKPSRRRDSQAGRLCDRRGRHRWRARDCRRSTGGTTRSWPRPARAGTSLDQAFRDRFLAAARPPVTR
jgi:nucleotide-binding universal stress UspA family protein